MKTLFLLSILLLKSVLWSQTTQHLTLKKQVTEKDMFPFIEGVYRDEIPLEKLGSKSGIQTPLNWEVFSFQLGYPSGTIYKLVTIKSNVIPDSTLIDIRKTCLNEQIYFTHILAKAPTGIVYEMVPMTLIPTWKDDE